MQMAENMVWTFREEPDAEYRLACIYTLAINTIEETRKPAPLTTGDKRLQNRYRYEAIRCLQFAYDGGFTSLFQTNIDADLAFLRDDPRMKEFQASHYYRLGTLEQKRGEAQKARAHFEKSQNLAQEWMKALPKDPRLQHVKIGWLCARLQLGHRAEAIKDADEIRPKLGKKGLALFRLARVYSLASATVDDPVLKEQYRTKAFTALMQAPDNTIQEHMLMSEVDFEPLYSDPRFAVTLRVYKKAKTR
jgi:tetratricopeptide (TPR) repeat protein